MNQSEGWGMYREAHQLKQMDLNNGIYFGHGIGIGEIAMK